MSATHPDLPMTNYPDSIDTFSPHIDIDAEALPYAINYYNYLLANNYSAAQSVLLEYPRLRQMIISNDDYSKIEQTMIALERDVYIKDRQIIFSDTQPTIQRTGDIWAQIVNSDSSKISIVMYECTGDGYVEIDFGINSDDITYNTNDGSSFAEAVAIVSPPTENALIVQSWNSTTGTLTVTY